MKKILTSGLVALGLSVAAVAPAVADEGAIKARKALMQIYAFNLGQLGAMAKGTMDYDSGAAQAAADNLLAAAKMDQRAMWPAGTDNVAMAGKTGALPEIWSTYPAIAEKGQALADAAAKMAEVAGTDLDGVRSAIGGVGGSCGGCHKVYRASNN